LLQIRTEFSIKQTCHCSSIEARLYSAFFYFIIPAARPLPRLAPPHFWKTVIRLVHILLTASTSIKRAIFRSLFYSATHNHNFCSQKYFPAKMSSAANAPKHFSTAARVYPPLQLDTTAIRQAQTLTSPKVPRVQGAPKWYVAFFHPRLLPGGVQAHCCP
jgi:hypothetical protein